MLSNVSWQKICLEKGSRYEEQEDGWGLEDGLREENWRESDGGHECEGNA